MVAKFNIQQLISQVLINKNASNFASVEHSYVPNTEKIWTSSGGPFPIILGG